MKKGLSILLVLAMALYLSVPAFAAQPDAEEAAITNQTEFLDYALNELVESTAFKINGIQVEDALPEASTRMVGSVRHVDGTVSPVYEAKLVYEVAVKEVVDANGVARATVYTKTESTNDDPNWLHDAEITLTITYEEGTMYDAGVDNVRYVKLTNVSADMHARYAGIRLSNPRVRGRYRGYDLDKDKFVSYNSPWYTGSSATISGAPLEDTIDGMRGFLYGDGACTLTRGNQTWDLEYTVSHTSLV